MHPTPIIRGLGFYAPEKILTNAELEEMVDTSDDWIVTRTGIRERRIAAEGENCTHLAYQASVRALEDAGMKAEDLTHVLVATLSPDAATPQVSTLLCDMLGIRHRTALDVVAACSGFLFTLETARAYLCLHPDAKILVTAAEILSRRTNYADRATCVLFGDGAGSVVLSGGEATDTPRVLDMELSTDGSLGDLLTVPGGYSATPYGPGHVVGDEHFIHMNGREVYKHAVRNMTEICKSLMDKHGVKGSDISVMVPHQANQRILEAVAKKLGIPEKRVFINVDRFGNTSAAALPMALAEARQTGFIKDGDLVLATTFGGGFTWGSGLIQF